MSRSTDRTAALPAHERPANWTAQVASALFWTIALPLAALATSVALAMSWREDLPDPVATGWGPEGVRSTGSILTQLAGLSALALLLCGLAFALAMRAGHASMTRRMANASATFVALLISGLLLAQLDAQRGAATAYDAAPLGWRLWLALGVTFGLAILAGVLTPGDPKRPARTGPPTEAARVNVDADEAVVWVQRFGGGVRPWMLVATVAVSAFVGLVASDWVWSLLPAAITVPLLLIFTDWTMAVDQRGLTVRGGFGLLTQHVPADEVESASRVLVDPLREWGGWGMRSAFDGSTGVIVRKGEGIEVLRSGGRRFVVTVDDAAAGAALLNTMAERARG